GKKTNNTGVWVRGDSGGGESDCCKSNWVVVVKTKSRGRLETELPETSEPFQVDVPHPARPVPETQPPDTLINPLVADDVVLIQLNNWMVEDEENEEPNGDTKEEEFIDDESSRDRGRGRGRAALSSKHALSPSPTTSTPGTSQVAPTIPPAIAVPSPQPAATDAQQVDASSQLNVDSSFDPDNNDCTQAISEVFELMLNELWLNYSEIPEDVQKWWFEKWAEGFTWPAAEIKQIWKAFDYRAGRRYQ
ncbi:hypothetical protein PIB30_047955, partial [Stylosanthes scabra]|nr:hypothetical protein [Stylosanthes scabra]